MKQYKTKPFIIEAVQWTGDNIEEIKQFCNNSITFTNLGEYYLISIHTLEGIMQASRGDYIIKGALGEYYPCDERVFNMKYEEI